MLYTEVFSQGLFDFYHQLIGALNKPEIDTLLDKLKQIGNYFCFIRLLESAMDQNEYHIFLNVYYFLVLDSIIFKYYISL